MTEPDARRLLQRLLSLMARVRVCDQACVTTADFCETHEKDWGQLERDVRKFLGKPGAN